jgi:NADPH-dependent 2,4-dienoyl-CoA reductase/sulfur reductase-like enzyme
MRRIAAAEDLRDLYDLAVIGAGPAGMAAATTAADHGLSVLVVDENAGPGGQIYRAITASPIGDRAVLGEEYWAGAALAEAMARSGVDYAPGAKLFSLLMPGEEETRPGLPELGVSLAGAAQTLQARELVVATGALERPFPIPGWTLPGVLTAGAAQTALKASGLVPDGRVVLAGTGPLLLLVAAQLQAAGARIDVVLDTTPAGNRRRALAHAAGFLRSPYLGKGLRLLARARGGPPVIRGATGLRAEGTDAVRAVTYRRGSTTESIACDLLLLHQGVVPNTVITNALGCAHDWDDAQLCWAPRLDAWLCTTVPGISVAGDGGGIAGAEAAAESGRLAALGAAARLGKLSAAERDRRAAPIRAALARWHGARRFLDTLYRPARGFRVPEAPETIVCRCEEVTAGQIRDAVARGATGPNQLKVFTRCGMGPCQGRLCNLTVTELVAAQRGVTPAEAGTYRVRPPFKPVTLGELAALPQTNAAVKAVVRY